VEGVLLVPAEMDARMKQGHFDDDFAEWVSPHLVVMANLAARLAGPADRDDVVQEALTRAWRKRHTFNASRGTPRVWLLAIVADRATLTRRRRRAHEPLSSSTSPALAAPDGTRVDLHRAVDTLPPRMRRAVDCFYFVGLTIGETAQLMGITEGTVKSTLAAARDHLRTQLEVAT
jgi:RNA polymerase sigma factor (sigma-70 family)